MVSQKISSNFQKISSNFIKFCQISTGQSGSGGSADNVSGYMGGSGVDPWSTYYKSPLLTEQLLLAHNRGMEKEMIGKSNF